MKEAEERYYNTLHLNRYFVIASVLFLGAIVWMILDDYFREWKGYQITFLKLKETGRESVSFSNKAVKAIRDLPILDFLNPSHKIEQYVIHDIPGENKFARVPRVDRCTTCHLGVLSPEFQTEKHPFRTHPRLDLFLSPNSPHPVEEFGCTSCHEGRGRGTDFLSAAHTPSSLDQKKEWETKYGWHRLDTWEYHMYPLQYVQAGCFKCHSEEPILAGADRLNLGLSLIEKAGCYGCHKVANYKIGNDEKIAANLSHIKAKLLKDGEEEAKKWLYLWIKQSTSFRPINWEPEYFGLDNNSDEESLKRADQEIHAIVYYLFAHSVDFPMAEMPVPGDATRGEELVAGIGCLSCHQIDGDKKNISPHSSYLLGVNDIKGLAYRFKSSKDTVSQYLNEKLSQKTKDVLKDVYYGKSLPITIQNALVGDLNKILLDPSLYDRDRFPNVELSPDIKNLLEQKGQGEMLIRLNRRLLEAAYPHEIRNSKFTLRLHELRREHGPNLSGIGTKTSTRWLYQWLKNSRLYNPHTRMLDFRVSDEEAADIAVYLASLKREDFMKIGVPATSEKILTDITMEFFGKMESSEIVQARAQKMALNEKLDYAGKKLIERYGCFGCHQIPGFENSQVVAPELLQIGSTPVHDFDFGFVKIEHTKEAWLKQKLQNPRIFDRNRVKKPDEKLNMPHFQFNEEELEAIVTVLLGSVRERPLISRVKHRTTKNLLIEDGQRLIRKYNCQVCHVIEGNGGTIEPIILEWLAKYKNNELTYLKDTQKRTDDQIKAFFNPPDLIGEGEKVHAEWLFHFLKNPEPIRPRLKVRMPTLRLPDEELNALLKYFLALEEQLPFVAYAPLSLNAEEFEAARQLVSSNYFFCNSCHVIGDKKPDSSPENWTADLSLARQRLRPDWIMKWLYHPKGIAPGVVMPDFFGGQRMAPNILEGNEDRQIQAIRNYLLLMGHYVNFLNSTHHILQNVQTDPKQAQSNYNNAPQTIVDALHYLSVQKKIMILKALPPSAMDLLVQNLEDNHSPYSQETLEVLHAIGTPAIPHLLEALKNAIPISHQQTIPDSVQRICNLLQLMGQPTVPELCSQLSKAQDLRLKVVLIKLLTDIGDTRAVPSLIETLSNSETRQYSTKALKSIWKNLPKDDPIRVKIQAALKKIPKENK